MSMSMRVIATEFVDRFATPKPRTGEFFLHVLPMCNAFSPRVSRCDEGYDPDGCWMGNWCQDKSEGGCQHNVPRHGENAPHIMDRCDRFHFFHFCFKK